MMKLFWLTVLTIICEYQLPVLSQWSTAGCFNRNSLPQVYDSFASDSLEDCTSSCSTNNFVGYLNAVGDCYCWDEPGFTAECDSTYTYPAMTQLELGGECDPPCGGTCNEEQQTCQCPDGYTLTTEDQSCYSTTESEVSTPLTSVFTVFGDPHVTVTKAAGRFCFDIKATGSATLNMLENTAAGLSITGGLVNCGNSMSCLQSITIQLGDASVTFAHNEILSNDAASYEWSSFTSYQYGAISIQATEGEMGKQKLVTLALSDTESIQMTVSSMALAANLQFIGLSLHNQDGIDASTTTGALGQFLEVDFSVNDGSLTFSPQLDQGDGISSVEVTQTQRYNPVTHERSDCYTYNGDNSHDLVQDDIQ